jgi:hypothetical protein
VVLIVLCLALTALWAISFRWTQQIGTWRQDVVRESVRKQSRGIYFTDGVIALASGDYEEPLLYWTQNLKTKPQSYNHWGWNRHADGWPAGLMDNDSILGFYYERLPGGKPYQGPFGAISQSRHVLRIPLPVFIIACTVPLLLRALREIRRRRGAAWERRRGLCHICGYDLRASFDVCPECGTPIRPDIIRQPLR